MVRKMDGELIPWTESFLTERMFEMIIEDNAMERQLVEAWVLQGSPVSPIHFQIETSVLIKGIEQYVSAAES